MLDRVTSMQVFVRVATLGGFSAASRALRMSQTMATKHVAAIEDRLGVKLFSRTTRRVTLTEAGRRYLESCERILSEIAEAETQAAADRLEPRGMLRLNAPVTFGLREIAPLLPEFRRLYPEVSFDLGLADRYVDLVEEGWDVAIRIGSLKSSSLVARKLAPARMAVCATPAYLAQHGTPRTVADLAGHNCLGYTLSAASPADRWSFGLQGEISVPVQGCMQANSGDALLVAALADQGLVWLPTFMVGEHLRAGRMVCLTLDHPMPTHLGVHAMRAAGRTAPAKVRAFVDFVAARFQPPPWDAGLPA